MPPASGNGRGEWWKWTAAALAAFIIGLIPFIMASRTLVQETEFDDVRDTQIEMLERLAILEANVLEIGNSHGGLSINVAALQQQIATLEAQLQSILPGAGDASAGEGEPIPGP